MQLSRKSAGVVPEPSSLLSTDVATPAQNGKTRS
jgi:hypothetical protein